MGTSVSKAQTMLVPFGYARRVDGAWGRYTQSVYDAAPDSVKQQVLLMFHAEGKTAPFEARWVPKSSAMAWVAQACARYNRSEMVPLFADFIELEARKRKGDSEVEYDANSVNGGSKGLMQMQRGAWLDAQKSDKTLPGYEEVFDPVMNIRAGICYSLRNEAQLKRVGTPINAETLYLAHNQGAGFFTRGARTAVDKQSAQVRRLIAKYSK